MKTLLSAMVAAAAALVMPQDSSRLSSPAPTNAPASAEPRRAVPFGVGEKMEYRAQLGAFSVGKAAIEVKQVATIRGRPTWNIEMMVTGSVLLVYNVTGTYSSWMDTTNLYSLQYSQDQVENKRKRQRFYDIFPERSAFRQRGTPDTLPEMPSVENPLDEASFMYFIRTIPLNVGDSLTFNRYFRPDRNPVTIRVLRKETVSVPAGIFDAIVIQPTIKTSSLFSEGGEAKIWISDDPRRMILKLYTKASAIAGLHLEMTKFTAAKPPPR